MGRLHDFRKLIFKFFVDRSLLSVATGGGERAEGKEGRLFLLLLLGRVLTPSNMNAVMEVGGCDQGAFVDGARTTANILAPAVFVLSACHAYSLSDGK